MNYVNRVIFGESPEEYNMSQASFKPFQSKNNKGICPNCDGTKVDPDKPDQKCADCQGKGYIEVHQEIKGVNS